MKVVRRKKENKKKCPRNVGASDQAICHFPETKGRPSVPEEKEWEKNTSGEYAHGETVFYREVSKITASVFVAAPVCLGSAVNFANSPLAAHFVLRPM